MSGVLRAENVTLAYSDHGKPVYACNQINLNVGHSEFIGILGPSGSGKSSLLYLLSGLKSPTAGSVTYAGTDIAKLSDDERSRLRLLEFGFVFQQPYLLGYLTVLENVLAAVPLQSKEAIDRAAELLDDLGLGSKMNRHPHELSGGERQRTCIARALINSPKVIFADEPTAALDHKNGVSVMDLLNRHRGDGALITVTHDETMITQANRVVRIAEGEIVPT
jgi:putative ABC transport system ATP-binding protein